jgi:crossover junction endodeoxyribonuclease RuvC
MVILGIDPGLAETGFGVLRDGRVIAQGAFRSATGEPLSERIGSIVNRMDNLIRRERPDACAVETLFFRGIGARSVILSAHLRGGLFYLLGKRGIPVTELTPATIKLTLTGNGRAAKRQMQYMVRTLLGIRETVPDHAADALAAAYCLAKKIKTATPPLSGRLGDTTPSSVPFDGRLETRRRMPDRTRSGARRQ